VGVSLFGLNAAYAGECPSPASEIATDRPDVTNSSLVVPAGSFQGENGINTSGQRAGPADPSNRQTTEATFVIEKKITDMASLFVEYVGDFPAKGRSIDLINMGVGYLRHILSSA
jgi:hypothetical protein